MLKTSLILTMLLGISSCGKLLIFPKMGSQEVCAPFTVVENNQHIIKSCKCKMKDFDLMEDTSGLYDMHPDYCFRESFIKDFTEVSGFFEEYRLFREDTKQKINENIKKKRVRKKLLKMLK